MLPPNELLPVNEAVAPRLFQIGMNAARAVTGSLVGVTPYEDVQQSNPFLQLGYTFCFKRNDQRIDVRIAMRELVTRPEHEIIQLMTKAMQHGSKPA